MNDNNTTTVFLCEETIESILTGVYEAYASHLGHSHIRLAFQEHYIPELFCETRTICSDPEKSQKVIQSIRRKISERAWQMILRASLSFEESRADDIYRFLVGGFYFGSKVTAMMTEPAVQRIFELNRAVANEAHYYREFLRFDSLNDRILFCRIRPKNDVLTLVIPHFADRIPSENFLIIDVNRRIAAIHPEQTDATRDTRSTANWFMTDITQEELDRLQVDPDDNFRQMWKTFYNTIAIQQRLNPNLQRNRMPLRYREFAPEFEK